MSLLSTDATRSDVVELRIPCRPEWVAIPRLTAATIASRLKLSIEDIEDVKLAVAEACTAVMQHDHHGEYIDITCEAHPDALRVHVRDGGRHGAADEGATAVDFDEARIAGLGIFLIRTLMDEVSFDVHPERGTRLFMVKRIGASAG